MAGRLAALVYDTPEGAEPLIQLLEYRRYRDGYAALERHGPFSRWPLARDAEQLNRLRLDVNERADNSIKFLSDMVYARAYRLAATKVGAGDYRSLVDQSFASTANSTSSWSTRLWWS